MFDTALDYARRGWPVFPLHTIVGGRCTCGEDCGEKAGKHPRIAGGFTHASTVELSIRNWWGRWPDANVGIATGKASGFFVVDVDPRHGGDDTLREVEAQHGPLPDTVESQTGGGGRHILFKYPGYPVKSGTDKLGPGLDIKADGGYIVASGSLHLSGRCYEWEVSSHPDDVPIAEAPAWLLVLLTAEATSSNGHDRFTVPEMIRDGQRNDTLYRLARSLKARGLTYEATLAALRAENKARCEPPLDDAEVKKIADNAYQQPDRPEFATNSNGEAKQESAQQTDPLALLRELPEAPDLAQVEPALRAMAATIAGTDPLRRRVLRQEAVALLKAKKVDGATGLVDAALTMTGDGATDDESQPVVLADPVPWPTLVDGADLLATIEKTVTRFVIVSHDAVVAIALWVLHAHALKAFSLSPILAVLSPTMRCGKTTLLSLLATLLPRALSTSNITPAALFRSLERYKPCLLVDEGDSFLTLSEELRGILNSGHTRSGAAVIRTVGDTFEPKIFSTWGAKVLAAIKSPPLPSTVVDRSIVIDMQRKAPGDGVERFRHTKLKELPPLCRQAARWAADNLDALCAADPSVPGQLNDRAADNWRPLLAIADLIGGEWPMRAREAALTLSGEAVQEESHHGVTLIGDIVAIFEARDTDRLSTTDIISDLVKREERPWSEWRHGKQITPRGVASLLKPFKIKPKVQRIGTDTPSGYERKVFVEAHTRYFPGSYPQHCQQFNEIDELDPISDPKQDPSVEDTKGDVTIEQQRIVEDVEDRNPENEAEAVYDLDFDTREPVVWEEL